MFVLEKGTEKQFLLLICICLTTALKLSIAITHADESIKIHDNESPVKRPRKMVKIVHSENIASRSFLNDYSHLCKELGCFEQNVNNIKHEYVKLFQSENKLLPLTWIVIRIDGSHFHRFSEVQGFEKPNDDQALKLMNSCAAAILEEFNDIVFAYGVSDEFSFSFVLKKNTQLYQRRPRCNCLLGLWLKLFVCFQKLLVGVQLSKCLLSLSLNLRM